MARADVRTALDRGWGPGTVLVMTEKPHSLADRSRGGPFDESEIVFRITRMDAHTVFGQLMYECGDRVHVEGDQPLTIQGVSWREVPEAALQQLLQYTGELGRRKA